MTEGALALQSSDDITLKAKGSASIEAIKDVLFSGENIEAAGKANAKVTGGAQATVSGKMTTVQGAGFKIDLN